MRRIAWSMLFVVTMAVLGVAGCDNSAATSQKSSGVGGGTTGGEGGKIKAPVGPGKEGAGGGS